MQPQGSTSLDAACSERVPACSPVREAQQLHEDQAEGAEGHWFARQVSRPRKTAIKEPHAAAMPSVQHCGFKRA